MQCEQRYNLQRTAYFIVVVNVLFNVKQLYLYAYILLFVKQDRKISVEVCRAEMDGT